MEDNRIQAVLVGLANLGSNKTVYRDTVSLGEHLVSFEGPMSAIATAISGAGEA